MSIYIQVWIVETFSYIQNIEYKNSDQTSKDIAVLVLTIFGSFGSSFCGTKWTSTISTIPGKQIKKVLKENKPK